MPIESGIVRCLENLTGVMRCRLLPDSLSAEILEAERRYGSSSFFPVNNAGLQMVFQRQRVLALLKDGTFRPPRVPTVLMVEVMDNHCASGPDVVSLGEKFYRIIGKELLGEHKEAGEEVLPISETFVIYPGRRGEASRPALFLLPPVPFPELEEKGEELGIHRIVSASPCSLSDAVIRDRLSFSRDRRFATLLIGFDLLGGTLPSAHIRA